MIRHLSREGGDRFKLHIWKTGGGVQVNVEVSKDSGSWATSMQSRWLDAVEDALKSKVELLRSRFGVADDNVTL